MKKKKIIIMLLALILMTGCDVKYNISLDNGKISEEIVIPYDEDYKEVYEDDYYYDVVNQNKYLSKIKKQDGINKFILTSKKVSVENLANNDLFHHCYDTIDVLLEDKIYYIGTSSYFKCMAYDYMELDNIEINIKTYNKVIQNNADKQFLNTYTWTINRSNFHDKNITFIVSKNEYVWYYRYKGLFTGLIIVGLIVIVGWAIIKFFLKRSEKANKI